MIKRDTIHNAPHRPIKSFVSRCGRISDAQSMALEQLWPRFGLSLNTGMVKWAETFGNDRGVIFEIGFGDGRSLVNQALMNPEFNYVGVEVYKPGIARLMHQVMKNDLSNIRVYCADALDVLEECVADNSLHGLQLFFPDPWPKLRHQKRRIVQTNFIDLVKRKVTSGGYVHMATDWEEYAQQMLAIMQAADGWKNESEGGGYIPRPASRMMTKFEQRGIGLGYGTWDILFRRV